MIHVIYLITKFTNDKNTVCTLKIESQEGWLPWDVSQLSECVGCVDLVYFEVLCRD